MELTNITLLNPPVPSEKLEILLSVGLSDKRGITASLYNIMFAMMYIINKIIVYTLSNDKLIILTSSLFLVILEDTVIIPNQNANMESVKYKKNGELIEKAKEDANS